MKNQSLYDKLAKGIGDAIVDVREKVVEEGWYGRVVNERESLTVQWPEAKEAQAIDCATPGRDHEPEQDIDR
jgi:hypothetical protein